MSSSSTLVQLKKTGREKRRRLIISAAMDLLQEKSLLEIGIRNISEKVGISSGALYNYFPGGRDQLFFEVLVQEIETLKGILGKKRAMENGIEALAQEGIDQLLDNGIVYQLMCYFTIRAKEGGETQVRLETARLILFQLMDSLIANQSDSDEMRSLNHFLFASILGSYLSYMHFPGMSPEAKREDMYKLAIGLIQRAHS